MRRRFIERAAVLVLLVTTQGLYAEAADDHTAADAKEEVAAVERAFAKTMANRDHEAFTKFLSDEAIFISGPMILRGKQAVADAWKVFFAGPDAPFSWEPETVEVLESGELALSSGPVRDARGTLVATYTSVWRQEDPGVWRIVLDKGNQACADPAASSEATTEPEAEPGPKPEAEPEQ